MLAVFSLERLGKTQLFDSIVGYEGIKRSFLRSLNSKEPVHILLVGPPGQAKTLFLKPYVVFKPFLINLITLVASGFSLISSLTRST